VHSCIDQRGTCFEEISKMLREAPSTALRRMLPDREILAACEAAEHRFREYSRDIIQVLSLTLRWGISRTHYCFLDKPPVGDNIVPWLQSHDTPLDSTAARVALSVKASS